MLREAVASLGPECFSFDEKNKRELFEEMGHSEEDSYSNEFVGDYNKAWDQAQ